jgi:hypothetical protein
MTDKRKGERDFGSYTNMKKRTKEETEDTRQNSK